MLKHAVIGLLAAGALLAQQAPPPPAGYDPGLWAKAWKLHHEALVIDGHADTTSRILDEGFDMGPRHGDGHMDLPRIFEGGLDAQFYSIYVSKVFAGDERLGPKGFGEGATPNGSARRALDMMDGLMRTAERYPGRMMLCSSTADIRKAVRAGKHAALMGIEGGHAIEGDLRLLRMFFTLGIRYMTLTHSNNNAFADSSGESKPRWGGLNRLGVKVVKEMNRLGMLVDVSHVADSTFFDVMEVTRAPVILSHSSMRVLCKHPRNMTDDMLRALRKNGGIVMINYNCAFVSEAYRLASQKAKAAGPRPTPPDLDALMAHFEHAIAVAGIDHVGLGSDFDGVPCVPRGMEDVTHLPRITYQLLAAGHSEADVRKVLGNNLMRVFERVEEVARKLAKEPPYMNERKTDSLPAAVR